MSVGAGAAPIVLVTAVGDAEGSRGVAAALACADADVDRATLLVDIGGRVPRPTLLASTAAQRLEERLATRLPEERMAARGQVCHLAVAADENGLEAASAAVTVARASAVVVVVVGAESDGADIPQRGLLPAYPPHHLDQRLTVVDRLLVTERSDIAVD